MLAGARTELTLHFSSVCSARKADISGRSMWDCLTLKVSKLKVRCHHFLIGLAVFLAATATACGSSAPEVARPVSDPEPPPASSTAKPVPSPMPAAASSASGEIVFVTQEEPVSLSAWSEGCGRNPSGAVCQEIASDPLTWIDGATYEVVPLTGVESWSQQAPYRWRFILREGITFHNGEPWNATAAKEGLDFLGDKETSGHGSGAFGFHGAISGRVIDEHTVDVACQVACPIFPRSAILTTFQAPEWWDTASAEERSNMTVGLGPYRIVERVPGVEVTLEAYPEYKPNNSFAAQAPAIKSARQVWRPEPLVRAALVAAGEAHWAVDIGFDNIHAVPIARTGASNEVFTLVADNIWHPELRKKGVREALALAVDCEILMDILYDGLQECISNISQWGTVGITKNNYAPYGHDPERARALLAENHYNPDNVVRIHTRADRVYRGLAMLESVVTMWEAVGVNAEVVVLDPGSAREVRLSGCGALEGPELQLDCVNQDPPGIGASTHYYETATSNEMLDMQRQLLLRTSCHNANSRVCNLAPGLDGMTFQESIADAIATPSGGERQRKMEALAQIIHDEYWFLPLFVPVQVYGLASNLEWEPRYDPRIRLNTMRFSEE